MSTIRAKARAAAPVAAQSAAWGHVIGVGAFLAICVFIPGWAEPFSMPKVVILTATAFACIPLIWMRRRALLAQRVPMILVTGFLACALLSQLLSGAPQATSFWGEWLRRTGTLTVIALCLILAAGAVLSRREIRTALSWIVWAGVPATIYGLVQLVGQDPFPWNNQGWIVSTFGNPNFAAAGLSILALLTAGLAWQGGFGTLWRVLMAPLAALEALLALQTGSSQAIFALGVGVVAGAVVWLLRWDSAHRVKALIGVGAAAVTGAVLTVWALFGGGPLVSLVSLDTLVFRQLYWGAALGMASSHPIVGVGPDGYGRFYSEFRPVEALQVGVDSSSNAHDVPLQWAATLGVPAALLYVALMATVAVVVFRRLWVQGPASSPIALPLLAVWAAYQVQSLVSIDAIPIAMIGWLATGLLLSLTVSERQDAETQVGAWASSGALAIVGLVLWLPALLASNASNSVVQGTTEQDVYEAIGLVAGTTLPCEPSQRVAQWMLQVAPSPTTADGVFVGAQADDRCLGLVNASAEISLRLEQADQALTYAQQGTVIDPLNYAQWILLARAQHSGGDDQGALNSLARALELNPAAQAEVDQAKLDLGLASAS